jgi:hypothetical protein
MNHTVLPSRGIKFYIPGLGKLIGLYCKKLYGEDREEPCHAMPIVECPAVYWPQLPLAKYSWPCKNFTPDAGLRGTAPHLAPEQQLLVAASNHLGCGSNQWLSEPRKLDKPGATSSSQKRYHINQGATADIPLETNTCERMTDRTSSMCRLLDMDGV